MTFVWTVDSFLQNGDDNLLEIYQDAVNPNYSSLITLTSGTKPSDTPSPSTPSPSQTPSPLPTSRCGTVTSASAADISSITSPTTTSSAASTSTSGGLTTGAEAGIGVGASIAGLALALGAFFLGIAVRKKNKASLDTESGSGIGKPELDGKEIHRHEVTAELDGDSAAVHELNSSIGTETRRKPEELVDQQRQAVPVVGRSELDSASNERTPPEHAELSGDAVSAEIDSRPVVPPPQDLPTTEKEGRSAVSPLKEGIPPEIDRRNTYDDPQLTQSPWAQDTADSQNQ